MDSKFDKILSPGKYRPQKLYGFVKEYIQNGVEVAPIWQRGYCVLHKRKIHPI
jgi:hypothetical protein